MIRQYSPAEESPRINLGASRSGGVPDNSCVGGAEKTSQKGSGGKAAFDPNAVLLGRKWWVGPAAAALTQDDLWSRGRVASYLLPEVSYGAVRYEVQHPCGEATLSQIVQGMEGISRDPRMSNIDGRR